MILCATINKKILQQLVNCKTTRMLQKIVLLHTQKDTNVHYLQEKFYNFQMQQTIDLTTFMGEIEMFISHLKNFGEDCFNDKAILMKLMCSFPFEYDSYSKHGKMLYHLRRCFKIEITFACRRMFHQEEHDSDQTRKIDSFLCQ